ncbi:hypothetical protein Tco_1275540 [Tanacetum coccineum]
MKFPTHKGIATLVTRTEIISECRRLEKKHMLDKEEGEHRESELVGDRETKEVSLTDEVLVNPAFPDQLIVIGGYLSRAYKDQLKTLLKKNLDVFSWKPSDMTGIPRQIIEHTLNVNIKVPYLDIQSDYSKERRRELEDVHLFLEHQLDMRYHQVQMDKDERKDRFLHRPKEHFATRKMPVLHIKVTMKSVTSQDISETSNLQKKSHTIESRKCSFGDWKKVSLRATWYSEGKRVKPKKSKALADMQSPRT